MTLRRSFSKIEHHSIRRKAIVMTMAVVMLVLIVKLGVQYGTMPPKMQYIKVVMIDRSTFIINKDTTNYENFASLLKEAVKEYRSKYAYKHIEIALKLPKAEKAEEIADIIKIVDAMDVQFSFFVSGE